MGTGAFIDELAWGGLAKRIVSGSQASEKLDRFSRGIGELNQRWQDRFIPERENLCEAYIKGRFEIALHGYVTGAGIA